MQNNAQIICSMENTIYLCRTCQVVYCSINGRFCRNVIVTYDDKDSRSKLYNIHSNKKGGSCIGNHPSCLCGYVYEYQSLGPAATRALPASLPSYLAKFLMKRPARSRAFSSHWAASA